jgi:uracil-DNA glycosylase
MSTPAIALLRTHLEQKAQHGTRFVSLRPEARSALATPGKAKGDAGFPACKTETPKPDSNPASAHINPSATPPAPSPTGLPLTGTTKEDQLTNLMAQAENWQPARALGTFRDRMVFAVGNPDAKLMFIGEAPGSEEERQSEPFVGPAGQRLTKIIQAMGLQRDEVYISNICKFRPAIENQGTKNRAPTTEEMRACLPFILAEIEIVQPQIIVALGATASTGLGIEGAVGKNRGRIHEVKGVPVIVTYHPSYILHQEGQAADKGMGAKRSVWEDMLLVMERLGLPISVKQRGYFKSAA